MGPWSRVRDHCGCDKEKRVVKAMTYHDYDVTMVSYPGTIGYIKDESLHLSDVTLAAKTEDECVRLCRTNPDCKLAVWRSMTDTGSCVHSLVADAKTIQYVDTESTLASQDYTTHIKPNCHAKCRDVRNEPNDSDAFSRSDGVCRFWRCDHGYCGNKAHVNYLDCRPCAYETTEE